MWKGRFRSLPIGPQTKRDRGDVEIPVDDDGSDDDEMKIDVVPPEHEPRKRQKPPFRMALLKYDSVLQGHLRMLNGSVAVDTERWALLERLSPWRYFSLPEEIENSFGALVFSRNDEKFYENFAADVISALKKQDALLRSEFMTFIEPIVRAFRAVEENIQSVFSAFLALFFVRCKRKSALISAYDRYASAAALRLTSKDSRFAPLVEELSKEDAALGVIRYFDPEQLRDIQAKRILAFAEPKARAALCTADRNLARICREGRSEIAEIRFLTVFGRDNPDESAESISSMRDLKEPLLGGDNKGLAWAEFYRAAVSAQALFTKLTAVPEPTKIEFFLTEFSENAARSRPSPQRKSEFSETTPEERRTGTLRVLLALLNRAGQGALCSNLILATLAFGSRPTFTFNPSGPRALYFNDLIFANGTVFDGRTAFQFVSDFLGTRAIGAYLVGNSRVTLKDFTLIFSQGQANISVWERGLDASGDPKYLYLLFKLHADPRVAMATKETLRDHFAAVLPPLVSVRYRTALQRSILRENPVVFSLYRRAFEQLAFRKALQDVVSGDNAGTIARICTDLLQTPDAKEEGNKSVVESIEVVLATACWQTLLYANKEFLEAVWECGVPQRIWNNSLDLAMRTYVLSPIALQSLRDLSRSAAGDKDTSLSKKIDDYLASPEFKQRQEEEEPRNNSSFIFPAPFPN